MASGDAQKVWFPEMLSILNENWNSKLSWEECGILCKEMTDFRDELRKRKNIKPAQMLCKSCGQYHEMGMSKITIRSLIFALKKSGKINNAELKKLDKDWKSFQRKNRLDGYGYPKEGKIEGLATLMKCSSDQKD